MNCCEDYLRLHGQLVEVLRPHFRDPVVVEAFEEVTGEEVPRELVDRRPGDVVEAWSDPAFAKDFLGWDTKRGLSEMLADAWRWQTQNPRGYREALDSGNSMS